MLLKWYSINTTVHNTDARSCFAYNSIKFVIRKRIAILAMQFIASRCVNANDRVGFEYNIEFCSFVRNAKILMYVRLTQCSWAA